MHMPRRADVGGANNKLRRMFLTEQTKILPKRKISDLGLCGLWERFYETFHPS